MASPTTPFRVIRGGKDHAEKQKALCAMDVVVAEVSTTLQRLTDSALFELDEEDIHQELACAVGALHMARLEIAKKVKR